MNVISLTSPRNARLQPPTEARSLRGWGALGRSGFRPFFLLAALFACLGVPLWLLALSGHASPGGVAGPRAWHGHEMIFGYAVAVIAGFLLTAAEKWTGRATIAGWPLLALAGLWLAGRVVWFWAISLSPALVAAVDALFLPALTCVVGRVIVTTRNRRNYGIVALLAAMSLGNLLVHLEALGLIGGVSSLMNRAALHLVTVMTLVIGGRIVPTFTRNATRSERVQAHPGWGKAAVALMVGVTVADLSGAPRVLPGLLALATAAAAGMAARHWGTREALRHPLLWILHAGWLWIVVSLVLRAAEAFGAPISGSAALHALTVGAVGSFTIGMMSRVSLGHTGRMIVSSPVTTLSFVLMTLAALCRVAVPELLPAWTMESWRAGGALWAAAFAAYLWKFAPLLVSPRVDGLPG